MSDKFKLDISVVVVAALKEQRHDIFNQVKISGIRHSKFHTKSIGGKSVIFEIRFYSGLKYNGENIGGHVENKSRP